MFTPPLILPVVVEEVVDDQESEAPSLILRCTGGGAGRSGAIYNGFRFAAPAWVLSICLAVR